jgi:hypothetical protein
LSLIESEGSSRHGEDAHLNLTEGLTGGTSRASNWFLVELLATVAPAILPVILGRLVALRSRFRRNGAGRRVTLVHGQAAGRSPTQASVFTPALVPWSSKWLVGKIGRMLWRDCFRGVAGGAPDNPVAEESRHIPHAARSAAGPLTSGIWGRCWSTMTTSSPPVAQAGWPRLCLRRNLCASAASPRRP